MGSWLWDCSQTQSRRFLLTLGLELLWKLVGNSDFFIKRIKENSGTSGEYSGDSVQNVLGDLTSCGFGFVLGTLFAALDLWWISLVWIVSSEGLCILYMRDSLILNMVTLLVHSKKLMQWQICKVPDTDSQHFISRLCKLCK